MKAYGGVEVGRHSFLASAIDGGERSASQHGRLTLLGKSARILFNRGQGGPQRRSGLSGEQKKLLHSLVTISTELALDGPRNKYRKQFSEILQHCKLIAKARVRKLSHSLFLYPLFMCMLDMNQHTTPRSIWNNIRMKINPSSMIKYHTVT